MRIRVVWSLAVSVVVAIIASAAVATPASAGTHIQVTQWTSSGGSIYSTNWFVPDDLTDRCAPGKAHFEVQDQYGVGFGTEAHLYVRPNPSAGWLRVSVIRATDDVVGKCLSIEKGWGVKLSTWKYNAGDKWDRVSGWGIA